MFGWLTKPIREGIIRPLIMKTLEGMMKEFIAPILDLIKTLVQPEKGTKFLLTLAGIGAIYFMHSKAIATLSSDVVIGLMVVAYYIADIYHKPKKEKPE